MPHFLHPVIFLGRGKVFLLFFIMFRYIELEFEGYDFGSQSVRSICITMVKIEKILSEDHFKIEQKQHFVMGFWYDDENCDLGFNRRRILMRLCFCTARGKRTKKVGEITNKIVKQLQNESELLRELAGPSLVKFKLVLAGRVASVCRQKLFRRSSRKLRKLSALHDDHPRRGCFPVFIDMILCSRLRRHSHSRHDSSPVNDQSAYEIVN